MQKSELKLIMIFNFLAIILIISACNPDMFMMGRGGDNMIEARKMNGIDSSEKIYENSFLIRKGGRVSLRSKYVTQLVADFTVETGSGNGMRFSFRTARNNFANHQRLYFDLMPEGCRVFENEKKLAEVDSVNLKYNSPYRVIIENDGINFNIMVDCDTVYRGQTQIHASEYVVVESLGESEIHLSGINFADIMDDF